MSRFSSNFAWKFFDHGADSVKHNCRNIFNNVLKHYVGTNDTESVQKFVKHVKSVEKTARSKWVATATLKILETDFLLRVWPTVREDILEQIGDPAIGSYAMEAYVDLMKASVDQKAKEDWSGPIFEVEDSEAFEILLNKIFKRGIEVRRKDSSELDDRDPKMLKMELLTMKAGKVSKSGSKDCYSIPLLRKWILSFHDDVRNLAGYKEKRNLFAWCSRFVFWLSNVSSPHEAPPKNSRQKRCPLSLIPSWRTSTWRNPAFGRNL